CVVDSDSGQTSGRGAKRNRSLVVEPAPDGERVAGRHLLQEPPSEEFGDDLLRRSALEVRGKLDAVVLALRGCGQNDQLSIGEFHGILLRLRRQTAPSPPKPRRGDEAGGVDPGNAWPTGAATVPLGSERIASPFWSGSKKIGIVAAAQLSGAVG